MVKLEYVLTPDGCTLGCEVDNFAKLILLQIGEEGFARKEWPLYRPGGLKIVMRVRAMVEHTTIMSSALVSNHDSGLTSMPAQLTRTSRVLSFPKGLAAAAMLSSSRESRSMMVAPVASSRTR
jgi:hypothetical protein